MYEQDSKGRLVIGRATFRNQLPQKLKKKFLNGGGRKITEILNKYKWSLSDKQFSSQNWDQIFWYTEEARCQILCVGSCYHPDIVKIISRPSYSNLQSLNISYNYIRNIENLVWIDLKNLNKLSFYSNYVTIIKPLNKLKSPLLTDVEGSRNIYSYESLNRIKLKNKDKQNNQATGYFYSDTGFRQGLFPLAKMEPSQCKQFFNIFESYIIQTKLMKCIERKYPKMQIKLY